MNGSAKRSFPYPEWILPLRLPFAGVPPRVAALRATLLAATFCGILASRRLWLTEREFPKVPVYSAFPQLPAPVDAVFLGVLLLALLIAFWRYRPFVIFFLAGALFLYFGDQNRGQPWFYLYCLMLALTLLPAPVSLAGGRLVVTAVYLWAGIQKCNPGYYSIVVPYMIEPVRDWNGGLVTVARLLVSAAPALEFFIAIALWVPVLRRVAITSAAALHVIALLILGPLGHNYNFVVWPWNLAMIALVLTLFPPVRLHETFRELRSSIAGLCTVAAVWFLPILSYSGRWDSYFSFALYSGNSAKADIFLTRATVGKLPGVLQRHAHSVHPDVLAHSPNLSGLFVFDYQSWAQAELGVPPVPEPRAYRAIARHLAQFASQSGDLHLTLQPRGGRVQVLQAGDLR